MIHAIRFPYWMMQALSIPVQDWGVSVIVDRGYVVQSGRLAVLQGIKQGMPAEKAAAIFPDAQLRERFSAAEEAWQDQISELFYSQTPKVDPAGEGIWFVLPEKPLGTFMSGFDLFKTVSTGISSDRYSALLAALKAGEGHTITLTGPKRGYFFENSPVDLLSGLGISEEHIQLLKWTGFETLKQVSQLTRRQLTLQFGETGALLHRLFSPGEDERRVKWYTPKPEIRLLAEMTYHDLTASVLEEVTERIALEAFQKLETKGFQLLRLSLREKPEHVFQKVIKEPVFDEGRIKRLLFTGLSAMLPQRLDEGFLECRFQLVRPAEGFTGDLFQKPDLDVAIKRVHKRYPGRLFSFRFKPHALFPEQGFLTALRV